jgi:probable DNA repair protein
VVSEARHRQTPVAWAQFISDLLRAAGWPGDAELTADEQDVIEAWKNAISELGTLGAVVASVPLEQALAMLRRILTRDRGIAPGSLSSPVQILDARDAPGVRWDAAIVTGLAEETWPPAIRVSPLIPLRLQVQQGAPGAGAAGFQQESRRLTEALFAAAPVTCATFHSSIAPIVRPFLDVQMAIAIGWPDAIPLESFMQAELPVVADTNAPVFQIVESPVPGGTGIIKAQSHCPFQAFAKYRLRAREMSDASFGYDALDRGNIVHRVLQKVWTRLETQAQLLEMPPDELRELVAECVAQSMQPEAVERTFSTQSRLAEQERVTGLILDWLNQVERPRRDSFAVEQVETEMQFDAAGLPITIRIDRIDRLEDGSVLLLDYKTGRASANDLNCPRPK